MIPEKIQQTIEFFKSKGEEIPIEQIEEWNRVYQEYIEIEKSSNQLLDPIYETMKDIKGPGHSTDKGVSNIPDGYFFANISHLGRKTDVIFKPVKDIENDRTKSHSTPVISDVIPNDLWWIKYIVYNDPSNISTPVYVEIYGQGYAQGINNCYLIGPHKVKYFYSPNTVVKGQHWHYLIRSIQKDSTTNQADFTFPEIWTNLNGNKLIGYRNPQSKLENLNNWKLTVTNHKEIDLTITQLLKGVNASDPSWKNVHNLQVRESSIGSLLIVSTLDERGEIVQEEPNYMLSGSVKSIEGLNYYYKKGNHGITQNHVGIRYVGGLNNEFLWDGQGRITGIGDAYSEGTFERGNLIKGRIVTSEHIYEGDFRLGKRHGFGVLTFNNGEKYEGQFENDMRNGHGKSIYPQYNDLIYEGKYVDDEKSGYGVQTFKKYGTVLKGDHNNDRLVKGTGHNENTGLSFEFNLIPNTKNHFRVKYSNESQFEGNFLYGLKVSGVERFANGDYYAGYYENDLFEAHGVYSYANGDSYVGLHSKGVKHGLGKLTKKDGTVLNGRWENDEFKGNDDDNDGGNHSKKDQSKQNKLTISQKRVHIPIWTRKNFASNRLFETNIILNNELQTNLKFSQWNISNISPLNSIIPHFKVNQMANIKLRTISVILKALK